MSGKTKTIETMPAVQDAVQVVRAASQAAAQNTAQVAAAVRQSAVEVSHHAQSAAQTATASIAGAVEQGQNQVKQQMEKVMKTAEEMVQFGQGNVEAVVKSGQIWFAGVQDLSKQVAANAQAQFDETVSILKALASVKSVREALNLQTTHARSTVEKAVAESSRLTDASFKLAEQAAAPIAARVSLAVEKLGRGSL